MSVQGSVITTASVLRTSDPKELLDTNNSIAPPPSSSLDASSVKAASDLATINTTAAAIPDDLQSCVSYGDESNPLVIQRTAGLLVIGDEILKGSTADTNTQSAAKALREHSVHLKRVVVVSDDQDSIVQEILAMQQEVGRYTE